MRNAFVEAITKLASKDDKIVLLTADVGYKIFDNFKSLYPDRFFNVGIAEANMASMAAGMALEGFKPYIYSMSVFVSMRCYEQIRLDIAYHSRNVKVVGVGSGYSYGHNGTTHHSIEDIALFRVMPGIKIVCPADPLEVEAALNFVSQDESPYYIRLGRAGESKIHTVVPDFFKQKSIVLCRGVDATIFTTGNMLETGIKTVNRLSELGINCGLVSMPFVKPLDVAEIQEHAFGTHHIYTLEEHNVVGGFGSAVSEYLSERGMYGCGFKRFGIPDWFTHFSGDREYLRKHSGLDVDSLVKKIEININRRVVL